MKKIIKKRGFKYLIAFLIPFFTLLSMTIKPLMANTFGEEILIKTKPFDPRDVFRGDYVQLDYEISEVPLEKVEDEILAMKNGNEYENFKGLEKKDLYVVLKKYKDFYMVDKVTLQKPNSGVFIKGKYRYPIYKELDKEELQKKENANYKIEVKGIRIDYALDKYFIPENTGKTLEEAARKGEVLAKIKVYNGYSLLKEILPIE
ncbi:GDYXXLXY domain-containing protein [Clostridium sp.]|jgi:uncharacterized membrane-anchored protein|uniref:GDYXXLXY domain-containing protein n=1 Tax=Clostridium sp. TaxID=1506 RepID=UPI0039F5216A